MKKEKKFNKVFVYGTLRSEYKGTHWDVSAIGTIRGSLYDLGAFPGVKLDDSGTVRGEVILVDDKDLEMLDRYEYVPLLYTREKTICTTSFGDELEVFVYVYQNAFNEEDRLPHGDWTLVDRLHNLY